MIEIYLTGCLVIFILFVLYGLYEDLTIKKQYHCKFGYNLLDGNWKKLSMFWVVVFMYSMPIINIFFIIFMMFCIIRNRLKGL